VLVRVCTGSDLQRESELSKQFNFDQLSQPSRFQALYAAVGGAVALSIHLTCSPSASRVCVCVCVSVCDVSFMHAMSALTINDSWYLQCIGENLMKREFSKAVSSIYHLTHDLIITPKRNALLDDVFDGIISYIHNMYSPSLPDKK